MPTNSYLNSYNEHKLEEFLYNLNKFLYVMLLLDEQKLSIILHILHMAHLLLPHEFMPHTKSNMILLILLT